MAQRPEDQPIGDQFKRDFASHSGFLPIAKDEPLWQDLSRSTNFIVECYDRDTGGFGQYPGAPPTVWATRMALQSFWWAHEGLEIDDGISRFKQAHGENAFEKTAQFISSNYHLGADVRNGRMIVIGGFMDPNDGVDVISTPLTQEGLNALVSLERLMGQTGTLARFEADHPEAFPRMLSLVKSHWVQIDRQTGAFGQSTHIPGPDIWGTLAALDIIYLSTLLRFQTHPEEVGSYVSAVKGATPQIFNYLRSIEYPDGGFGFVPGSGVENIFSMNQVVQIVDKLLFFNHPDELEDAETTQAFIAEHNFEPQVKRLQRNIMAHKDPETGGFAGYKLVYSVLSTEGEHRTTPKKSVLDITLRDIFDSFRNWFPRG